MIRRLVVVAALIACFPSACSRAPDGRAAEPAAARPAPQQKEQAFPLDPENIVNIAAKSPDHTTLVAALKAADYVKSVANPGPLTVFAPTNAAFARLPAGTLDELLKPEKQGDLKEIIKYHATTTAYDAAALAKMPELAMANGKKVKIRSVDGKLQVNDATVIASVRGSNGWVHVIDAVLLPPAN